MGVGPEVLAPFLPSSLSGLAAWWAADKITGLSNGGTITTWSDSSGNGNTMTAAGTKPTWNTNVKNGLPAVSFGGAGYFTSSYAQNTAISVFVAGTNGGNGTFLGSITVTNPAGGYLLGSNGGTGAGNAIFQAASGTASWPSTSVNAGAMGTTSAWNYLSGTTSAAAGSTLYLNGTSEGNAPTNGGIVAGPGLTIGALLYSGVEHQFLTGYIGEVIAYNRVLNSTELAQVHAYLSRWS